MLTNGWSNFHLFAGNIDNHITNLSTFFRLRKISIPPKTSRNVT